MNDIVKFPGGSLPATSDDLLAGLATVEQDISANAVGVPFLRLGKDGIFIYGQEDQEVQPGSHWALNPFSIHHGWACWDSDNSVLIDEVMVPFNQPVPPKGTLAESGFPWKKQYAVILACINGEDEGKSVQYKGTSLGMQNWMRELIQAIQKQGRKDKNNIVPILDLESDSYKHPQWGKIYIPVLNVVNWVSMDFEGDDADDEEVEEAPPPKKKAAAKKKTAAKKPAETESVDEADDEPPARTRRRRAV